MRTAVRWIAGIVGVLVIVAIVSALVAGDETGDTGAESQETPQAVETTTSSTVPGPTTSTPTETTTTTTAPVTTTSAAPLPSWTRFSVDGSGDDVIDLVIPDNDAAALVITHSGSGNFAVTSYDDAGQRLDLLVNEIGAYSGVRPVNLFDGESVAVLEIVAGGSWSIEARPLAAVEHVFDGGTVAGTGDAVVVDTDPPGAAERLTVTHTGDSNFAVTAFSARERRLLINEIGPYSGTVLGLPDALLFEVIADGDWTLVYE